MKTLFAIVILADKRCIRSSSINRHKDFIQECKEPVEYCSAQLFYCVIAGVVDTSHDIEVHDWLGEVLEATTGWIRSQELSSGSFTAN